MLRKISKLKMVKEYRGGGIVISPPDVGWSSLLYADGFKCIVSEAKIVVKDGQKMVRFYLQPYESTAKRFNIDRKKDLDSKGYCYKWYPQEYVKPLNSYDPNRRIFFCLVDFDGKETESTGWFLGKEQADEIIRKDRVIRESKAHNERLKYDIHIMKTNVQKYIKEQMEGVINPLMPFIKGLLESEAKKEGG